MIRVGCYVDGFNLYHAIDDMSRASRGALNYLKWLDLTALTKQFTDPAIHRLSVVKYFSAYPTWRPDQVVRHKAYIAALEASGVQVVLGQFKEKDAFCKICRKHYKAHEEKESDVNIAAHLINDAHRGEIDQVFMVTRDSDLCGPIRVLKSALPHIKVKVIAPPQRRHSKELWALAHLRASVQQSHLEKALFPKEPTNRAGIGVCVRPAEYDPPS